MTKNTKLIDMSGQIFGEWKILSKAGNAKGGAALWNAICSCGNKSVVIGSDLRNKKSTNCGCKQYKTVSKLMTTHGGSKTRLYRIWKAMHTRCFNPNVKNYAIKNLTIEWPSFLDFKKWAEANGYKDNLSIDRIDNSKGYSAENCRWADYQTQSVNRDFVLKDNSGKAYCEIAKENNIPVMLMHGRVHEGWPIELACRLPKGSRLKSHI